MSILSKEAGGNPGKNANKGKRIWFKDPAMFLLTFVTFIALIAYAYYTRDLALSTQLLVTNTKRNSETQLRAYVAAEPGPIYHVNAVGSPLVAYLVIRNTGQTPAYEVKRTIGISLLAPPVPPRRDLLGRVRRVEGVLVLQPRAQNHILETLKRILTEGEVAKIISPGGEKLRIYVFGTITYKDVFGGEHFTHYCHMYFGNLAVPDQPLGYLGRQGRYCDKHNETDDIPAARQR